MVDKWLSLLNHAYTKAVVTTGLSLWLTVEKNIVTVMVVLEQKGSLPLLGPQKPLWHHQFRKGTFFFIKLKQDISGYQGIMHLPS